VKLKKMPTLKKMSIQQSCNLASNLAAIIAQRRKDLETHNQISEEEDDSSSGREVFSSEEDDW
jgi:hypothetical protein